MSRILIKTQETFRVDSQEEVDLLLAESQESGDYELMGHSATRKVTKDDEYFVVTLKKQFNNEKNPV